MALIMVDVEEAAQRLDELVDAAVAGAEVIMGREGRPLAVMVRFDPRRPGSGAGHPAGRGRYAEAPEEPAPTGARDREMVVEHIVGIAVYMI
jgi:antitoxin (DNA-binding transcriptional repressor) of toxin-antitoxin stability system